MQYPGRIQNFYDWLRLGKSPATAQTYASVILRFARYYQLKNISDISQSQITDFLLSFNPRTSASYAYALKSFLDFNGRAELARMVPVPGYSIPEPQWIPVEKVNQMIRICRPGLQKCVVWMAYEAALRVSELCRLDRTDLSDSRLRVQRSKGKKGIPTPHTVPIDPELAKALEGYTASRNDKNPALFVTRETHRRLSPQETNKMIARAGKMIGLEVSCHLLRHSRATVLAMQGWGPYELATFLGHRNLNSTLAYISYSTEWLRQRQQVPATVPAATA